MENFKIWLSPNELKTEFFIDNVQKYYDKMILELEDKLGDFLSADYFFMEAQNVYYDKKTVALFPKFKDFVKKDLQKNTIAALANELEYFKEGNGFDWDFLTAEEVKRAFSHNVSHPFKFGDYYLKFAANNASYLAYKDVNKVSFYYTFSNSYDEEFGSLIGIHRLKGENATEVSNKEMLILWLENGLTPLGMDPAQHDLYIGLLNEFSKYKIKYNDEGKIESFDNDTVIDAVKLGKFTISADRIAKKLLRSDSVRLGIEPYPEERIFDKNLGDWDIFPDKQETNHYDIAIDKAVYSRDPHEDIRYGGAIGIDMGARSCVIVYQKDNDLTLPVIFGKDLLSTKSIYENASALKITNLEKFMKDYNSSEARPYTSWEDVSIPSLEEIDKEDLDKNGIVTDLLKKSDSDVDLIEIYAYYVGSFINNMNNGIYLDYSLSFSSMITRERREEILESFRRGIIKSLPLSIVSDEETMSRLNIGYGASNATAYAISAINDLNLAPKDDKSILFAAFDVGANVTDYSFGFVRPSYKKTYDYIVEDFEIYGDDELGGEKILRKMALEVFNNNLDVIADNNIKISIADFYSKNVSGEYKKDNATTMNVNLMMDKLRKFLEEPRDREINYMDNRVRVDLFDDKDHMIPNLPFKMDFDSLDQIAAGVMENAVKNFFIRMKTLFGRVHSYVKCKNVYIFLGGNGSRSYVLRDIFDKIIAKEQAITDYKYDLYLPIDNTDLSRPNTKTATAFGVLNARPGGRIKLIQRNSDTIIFEADRFPYYVGYNNNGKLHCVIHPNSSFETWEVLYEAEDEFFEIYYTNASEAVTNDLDILKTQRKRVRIKADAFGNIYIRPRNTNVLEYIVATPEEIKKPIFSENIGAIDLTK